MRFPSSCAGFFIERGVYDALLVNKSLFAFDQPLPGVCHVAGKCNLAVYLRSSHTR